MKQKGVALIQVLIITAILSIIALFMTKSAKQQVQIAQWGLDKTEAFLEGYSVENKIIFELLTNNLDSLAQSGISTNKDWNLYGKAFKVGQYSTVSIQDNAGLLNLQYPNPELFKAQLRSLGLNPAEQGLILSVLLDWQDGDRLPRNNGSERAYFRNAPMLDKREWYIHNSLSEEMLDRVIDNFTIPGLSYINFMNSPESVLKVHFSPQVVSRIIKAREAKELTRRRMKEITNIVEDEDVFFTSSDQYQISINVDFHQSSYRRSMLIDLEPYVLNSPPYSVFSSTGG
ncbi:general secretion pathway protein GspK [Catenovulum sp. SM1970]|uniref:general secretion pathway protein GspK n=1 Tax=Marinifaba aquimaris TaxID=2741323 RepID=UPI0015732DC1|nr:type II secretion system protein GspK [Marinifaba aquimaris]NTS76914.1 general secretion pathway protein GspK [Marinifaba aquimaris]